MNVNKEDYEYCIEVERGKYHIVLTKDYQVKFLRGGDDWVDNPPGSKMMIALMAETEQKEQENKRLREALEFYADEAMYEKKLVSKSLCPQIEPDEYTPAYITRFDKGYRARKALGGEGIDIPSEG